MSTAVVAAHPDDETLGCGATVAKLATQEDVHIIVLGDGITARREAKDDTSAIDALYTDAQAAAQTLGAASLHFARLPDLRFDTVSLLDVVWEVERMLREISPSRIFTHHGGDLNRDHQITLRAVLAATRPMAGCPVRDVYSFEVPSATEWAFGGSGSAFAPNVFVDVGDCLEKKIQAMECYRTERREPPHPRSPQALRALAGYRGSTSGFEYAEAFRLVRSVRDDFGDRGGS